MSQPFDQPGSGGASIPLMTMVFVAITALAAGLTYLVRSGDESESAGPATNPTPTVPVAPVVTSPPRLVPADTLAPITVTLPSVPGETAAPSTDPNQLARDDLDRIMFFDRPTVDALAEQWVPQISAKRVGIEDDGIVYQFTDILRKHQEFQRDFGAVLLFSSSFVFASQDLYISIIPQGFATPDEALAVCTARALGPDDCFARLLTRDRSVRARDTVKMQA